MVICYISDGSSVHTQRWLNYFASKGHKIHLVCWKIIPGYDRNIQIHLLKQYSKKLHISSRYINYIIWCIQIWKLVKNIKPDIIDGHYVTIYGFLAACSNFRPLVVTAWGSDILVSAKNNPVFRFMAKFALKRADRVVCTASVVQGEILKLGIGSDKINTIVIGGIDKKKLKPLGKNEALLASLGIKVNEPVIISTRHLNTIYDVQTLIKAIPIILQDTPSAKCIIVGRGNQESYLHELADKSNILKNVMFTGWLPNDKIPSFLFSSDIYVSTSLSDGTSNSLLEAMACELTPVVTDIPANRQWIKESENGYFFPPGDYMTLAKKVVYLLNNVKERKTFGYRNRRIVELNADTDIEMSKLEGVYSQLINEYRQRRKIQSS